MKKLFQIIAVALCVAPAFAGVEDDPKYSKAAEKTAAQLRKKITEEIKVLGTHEWAGEYYYGDGTGVNVTMVLAPKGGYLFEWHGCLGLYDRNYGKVTNLNGRLRLFFTFPNERKGFQGIAEEFVPVSWGTREYLIPADDVIGFCNEVNEGSEPRDSAWGSYPLRKGDEHKQVSGFPNVPAEYQAYLLTKPITAEIVTVGPYTTRPSVVEWKIKDTPVVLNAGKDKGLRPGMKLLVTSPDVVESVRVNKVGDSTAEGIMTQPGEDAPDPKVGWRLSTLAPWHKNKAKESTSKEAAGD